MTEQWYVGLRIIRRLECRAVHMEVFLLRLEDPLILLEHPVDALLVSLLVGDPLRSLLFVALDLIQLVTVFHELSKILGHLLEQSGLPPRLDLTYLDEVVIIVRIRPLSRLLAFLDQHPEDLLVVALRLELGRVRVVLFREQFLGLGLRL